MEAVEARRRRLTVSTSTISRKDAEMEVEEDVEEHLNDCVKEEHVEHRIVDAHNLINEKIHDNITMPMGRRINEMGELTPISPLSSTETPVSSVPAGATQYKVRDEVLSFEEIKEQKILNETLDSFKATMGNKGKMNTLLYITNGEEKEECMSCEEFDKAHEENLKLNEDLYPSGLGEHYLSEFCFVLGSTSLSRKYVMDHNRLNYVLVPTNINERCIGNRKTDHPFVITSNIAIGKLLKLQHIIENDMDIKRELDRISESKRVVLVTGDELIYCNRQIYEKPRSPEEAADFLQTYGNNVCSSYCSVCICDYKTRRLLTGVDKSDITMRPLSDRAIHEIIQDSYVYFCAGAFKIEHKEMSRHIESIKGRIDSIFGLSVKLLTHLVRLL